MFTNLTLQECIQLIMEKTNQFERHELVIQLIKERNIKHFTELLELFELGKLTDDEEKALIKSKLPNRLYQYCTQIVRLKDKQYQKYFDICFPLILHHKNLCRDFLFKEGFVVYNLAFRDELTVIDSFRLFISPYLEWLYQSYDDYFFSYLLQRGSIVKAHVLYFTIFGRYYNDHHYQLIYDKLIDFISSSTSNYHKSSTIKKMKVWLIDFPDEWKDKMNSLFSLFLMKNY